LKKSLNIKEEEKRGDTENMKKKGEEVPDLSLEMEVIFRSIGVKENREAAIAKLLKKDINWVKVKKNALSHNVLPLLYGALKNLGEPLVPQGEMSQIKSIYRNIALKNLRHAQNLHRVIELLSANGVSVIAFKGLALSVQAYGDLSLRNFCDLDLLIHTKDFCKIYELLTDAGFSQPFSPYEQDETILDGVSEGFRVHRWYKHP